jgi:hypothetical protein
MVRLMADYWMWGLHVFFDREENLQSKIALVRATSEEFQHHHAKPVEILQENHLGTITGSINVFGGNAVFWTCVLGTSLLCKIAVLTIALFGSIGALNHYYCHARNNSVPIPMLFSLLQDAGALPAPSFHKSHHTNPFDSNWSFLRGLGKGYESLHSLPGSTYMGASLAFYSSTLLILLLPFA